MRIIVGVVAATAVLVAGTAVAGPCDDAGRGTYQSNVCFLLEEFTERNVLWPIEIASFNKEDCTVTLTEPYLGLAGDTVYFNRAERRRTRVYHFSTNATCWHLAGEGVSGEDKGSDTATVCSRRFSLDRLDRALENLYAKYCRGQGEDSEF